MSVVDIHGKRITTAADLAHDLEASIRLRGWPAGTTLLDFYHACLRAGATPDTPLRSIEYGNATHGSGRIVIDFEPEGIDITETRA